MFPLLRIALFFIVGIIVGDALEGVVGFVVWQWTFLVMLLVAVGAYFCLKEHPILQTWLVFILYAVGGAWRASYYANSIDVVVKDVAEDYEAVVVTDPVDKGRSVSCQLLITNGRLVRHRIVAYFAKNDGVGDSGRPQHFMGDGLELGDGIVARSCIDKALWSGYDNSGSKFDYGRWLMVHEVSGRTFLGADDYRCEAVSLEHLSGLQRLQVICSKIRKRALRLLAMAGVEGDAYAVVSAMTLGSKTALNSRLREVFSRSGVSHVLALSGLHLGMIYALLAFVFLPRLYSLWRLLIGNVVVLLAIWAYTVMVGMTPSITRAAVMTTVLVCAGVLSRNSMSLNNLGLAALVSLLINPMSLWNVSFQMSFMAVFGIMMCSERLRNVPPNKYVQRYRLLAWLWSTLKVSVSAQLMVAPLVLFYFGRFSMYFIIANIIAVPLSALLLYLTVAFFLLSPLPWLATLMARLLSWDVSIMNACLGWVAALPKASIDNVDIGVAQAILLYVFLAILYILSYYFEMLYRIRFGYKIDFEVRKH